MKHMRWLWLSAAALSCAPAMARDDKVEITPPPDWVVPTALLDVPADAQGLVFMRGQEFVTHLGPQGDETYNSYRVRVLHPNALAAGNIGFSWNPAAGAAKVHAIRLYRGAEVIDVLKTTSFQLLRREDRLEEAMLDGMLTAVLHVPDLRVGDELEVAYTLPASDPTLGQASSGALAIFPEPPPGRYRLGLRWAAGQQPRTKIFSLPAGQVRENSGGLDLMMDNPSKLQPVKDAPSRFNIPRLIQFSDFADWPAVSRTLAPLFLKAATLAPRSPLKAEAARIAATTADPAARAAAALELVQREVRYVYVGLNGGNLAPVDADTTWQRRYGDCKAKTALLIALLSELGIEASPVLVANSGDDEAIDQLLPSPSPFDHVIVQTLIDGKVRYLDGTMPPVVAPGDKPLLPYHFVLPLTSTGEGLRTIAWRRPDHPDTITLYDIDASAGFAAPARLTQTAVVRGIEGVKQYAQFSGLTPSQLTDAFRTNAVGEFWQSIGTVAWRYDKAHEASILTITGTANMDWERSGLTQKMFLPGGGFSPPNKRFRPPEQDQTLPYVNSDVAYDCRVATLKLPAGTKPTNWNLATAFDREYFGSEYYRAVEQRAGTVRMVSSARTDVREIDAATARLDNARLTGFDNSKAQVIFDPARRAIPRSVERPVPAIGEIDWIANDEACIGPPGRS